MSRAGESHPCALEELDVNLSVHTAPSWNRFLDSDVPVRPELGLSLGESLQPERGPDSMTTEFLVFPARPPDQGELQWPEHVDQAEAVIPPIVLHPTSDLRIAPLCQFEEGLVTASMQLPAPNLVPDALGRLVADRRSEAEENDPLAISRGAGPELEAQKREALGFVVFPPIRILAISDFGFLEVELQSARL